MIDSWENPGVLAWYKNKDGGTQWERHLIADSLNMPSNMLSSVGDIDNDADIDVALVTTDDGVVIWFENVAGDSIWLKHEIANIRKYSICTILADMDGDLDLDIVAGNYVYGDIFWFENQLPDTTWQSTKIATLSGSPAAECKDMDGDGDLDLVTFSNRSNQVVWYSNPSWQKNTILTGYSLINMGSVGDLDGDGDLDVTCGAINNVG